MRQWVIFFGPRVGLISINHNWLQNGRHVTLSSSLDRSSHAHQQTHRRDTHIEKRMNGQRIGLGHQLSSKMKKAESKVSDKEKRNDGDDDGCFSIVFLSVNFFFILTSGRRQIAVSGEAGEEEKSESNCVFRPTPGLITATIQTRRGPRRPDRDRRLSRRRLIARNGFHLDRVAPPVLCVCVCVCVCIQ